MRVQRSSQRKVWMVGITMRMSCQLTGGRLPLVNGSAVESRKSALPVRSARSHPGELALQIVVKGPNLRVARGPGVSAGSHAHITLHGYYTETWLTGGSSCSAAETWRSLLFSEGAHVKISLLSRCSFWRSRWGGDKRLKVRGGCSCNCLRWT